MVPYLLVNIFAFYFLPFLIKNTTVAMLIMLIGLPTICFITSVLFGTKNSFNRLYPIIIGLIFAPTTFIFYNESAIIYIAVYSIIALAGNFIGKLFYKVN